MFCSPVLIDDVVIICSLGRDSEALVPFSLYPTLVVPRPRPRVFGSCLPLGTCTCRTEFWACDIYVHCKQPYTYHLPSRTLCDTYVSCRNCLSRCRASPERLFFRLSAIAYLHFTWDTCSACSHPSDYFEHMRVRSDIQLLAGFVL